MAFSVGVSVSAATVIGSRVINVLSSELGVPWLGRIVGIVPPILGFGELAFSATANAYPFLAIAGVICGLMIGLLAICALDYVRLFVLHTPGAIAEAMEDVSPLYRR